jgi:hypothetical protein
MQNKSTWNWIYDQLWEFVDDVLLRVNRVLEHVTAGLKQICNIQTVGGSLARYAHQ